MANVKISNLTAATTPLAGTEVLPIVQSGATVKASIANVQTATYSGGTANGVAYLNGSKVLTSGSALVFDGTNFSTTGTATATKFIPTGTSAAGNGMFLPSADTLGFSTGGAEKGRFSSSAYGVFTVGNQSSVGSLGTDYGTIGAWGSSGGGYRIYRGTSAGTPIGNFYADATGIFIIGSEAVPLVFSTNATERARFNAGAPILCLSGGSTTATGTGIAFPSTQSASSNVNTLDDYEEGTFTPTCTLVTPGTSSSGSAVGVYTKVGNLVTATGRITFTKGTGTGDVVLGGLPFTSTNTATYQNSGAISTDSVGGAGKTFAILLGANSTAPSLIAITQVGGAGAVAAAGDLGTSAGIRYTFSYQID